MSHSKLWRVASRHSISRRISGSVIRPGSLPPRLVNDPRSSWIIESTTVSCSSKLRDEIEVEGGSEYGMDCVFMVRGKTQLSMPEFGAASRRGYASGSGEE